MPERQEECRGEWRSFAPAPGELAPASGGADRAKCRCVRAPGASVPAWGDAHDVRVVPKGRKVVAMQLHGDASDPQVVPIGRKVVAFERRELPLQLRKTRAASERRARVFGARTSTSCRRDRARCRCYRMPGAPISLLGDAYGFLARPYRPRAVAFGFDVGANRIQEAPMPIREDPSGCPMRPHRGQAITLSDDPTIVTKLRRVSNLMTRRTRHPSPRSCRTFRDRPLGRACPDSNGNRSDENLCSPSPRQIRQAIAFSGLSRCVAFDVPGLAIRPALRERLPVSPTNTKRRYVI